MTPSAPLVQPRPLGLGWATIQDLNIAPGHRLGITLAANATQFVWEYTS
jgi:hypothetical protein